MKTLSEHEAEQASIEKARRDTHNERCRDLLQSSEGVQVFRPTTPGDQTDYAGVCIRTRVTLASGNVTFYGLACDYCGTELINTEPGACCMSSPPCYRAACPGCGWLGWKR
jgi:hypothetical protein